MSDAILSFKEAPMTRNVLAKRIFDLLVSVPLLFLLIPVFLVAAIAVKIASPGPVLYRARRSGQFGQIYTMHKFRTMHVGSDRSGPAITGPNDPRIFYVGEVLRKTKLDELPQLYDVVRGKMSIVGPRPEDPGIVDKYYTDRHKETLQVKPGITSPAALHFSQAADEKLSKGDVIESYVNDVLDSKIEMELAYLEHSSVLTDAKILIQSMVYVARVFIQKAFNALLR